MTTVASTPKLFLSQLSIPVNRMMIGTAVACAEQVAQILSMDPKENKNLQLAVEEAVGNAVHHFSDIPGQDERIHVEFYIDGDQLIISILDKGIPFNLRNVEKYTPKNLDSMDRPGLGMRLMHKGVDSVELLMHGRAGKEIRLTKNLPHELLPEELRGCSQLKHKKKRESVKNSICRPSNLEDLPDICRLAWKCYGYTQEEFLYDTNALTEKFKTGEFKSIIIIDTDRNIILGHIGLKYHDPAIKVSEAGLGFLDPTYRFPGATKRLGKAAINLSRNHGDMGMFDCSVTTHTFSQKIIQELGSSPCGLLLGITAMGMTVKELAVSEQTKGSTVNHYYAFDRSPKTIYIPVQHQKMVKQIYQWMELPREIKDSGEKAVSGESSTDVFNLPDELNVSFIIVNKIGRESVSDVVKAFEECKGNRKDAVYVMLPTDEPSCPYLVGELEKIGFSFSGVMPHIHNGGDRITLQWLNVKLDMDAIRVYGDKTRKVFDYIKSELKRVKNI